MSFNIVHRSRGVRHRVGAMFPSRKNNANVDKDKQSIGKRTKQTDEEHEIVIDFVTLGMFIIGIALILFFCCAPREVHIFTVVVPRLMMCSILRRDRVSSSPRPS